MFGSKKREREERAFQHYARLHKDVQDWKEKYKDAYIALQSACDDISCFIDIHKGEAMEFYLKNPDHSLFDEVRAGRLNSFCYDRAKKNA